MCRIYMYYVSFTAEVSQILVSCKTPIQWEQFCLANTCSIGINKSTAHKHARDPKQSWDPRLLHSQML